MPNKRSRLLLTVLGGSDPSASFTVTTSGAQTLTWDYFAVSASTTVDWGDGSSDTYTTNAGRTHNYAGAGSYRVRILQPLNVTALQMESPGVLFSFDSAILGRMTNCTNFRVNCLNARTSTFYSSHFSAWRPLYFVVYNGGANVTGAFNSADVMNWSALQLWYHLSMGSVTPTITQTDFNGLIAFNNGNIAGNALSQAQVNAVLLGLYTAAQSKTANGGTLVIDGTNAAPSGTYGAANPPTTGKAAAYELINDSAGVIPAGKEWVTITVTGGLP
jgi:hypothetical protein